ncbi:MAG: helix-turn-helix transcriptional regulator [Lachnospiraceae bacterium]
MRTVRNHMRVYPPFDGVTVMLTQLETHGFLEDRPQRDRLEINFCVNGRFESHFSSRDLAVLKPGDMAVSTFDGVHGLHSHSDFPLGYYEGVCITVDCAPAEAGGCAATSPRWPVTSSLPSRRTRRASQWHAVCRAGPRCEHVFRELFENLPYFDRRTLTLKALELFSLLETIPRAELSREYCSAEQLRLARHLRDHLLTNRNNYVSLARLAEEHQISVSHLQRLFRQVYGMPVYHYIREYRLEQAAVELLSSRKHIVEIAMDAGYDSASKFSAAFKARYGVTPSAYRCAAGNETKWAIQTKTE